jgi:hypothetical protein
MSANTFPAFNSAVEELTARVSALIAEVTGILTHAEMVTGAMSPETIQAVKDAAITAVNQAAIASSQATESSTSASEAGTSAIAAEASAVRSEASAIVAGEKAAIALSAATAAASSAVAVSVVSAEESAQIATAKALEASTFAAQAGTHANTATLRVADATASADAASAFASSARAYSESSESHAGVSHGYAMVAGDIRDELRNQYYGLAATDPLNRPNVTTMQVGDEYFNTTINRRRVFLQDGWVDLLGSANKLISDPLPAMAVAGGATVRTESENTSKEGLMLARVKCLVSAVSGLYDILVYAGDVLVYRADGISGVYEDSFPVFSTGVGKVSVEIINHGATTVTFTPSLLYTLYGY